MKSLTLPISNEAILDLHKGDPVALTGAMVLGRDAAHKGCTRRSSRSHASRRATIWKSTKR
jgi:tartrate dehydratase beta subunit/fumarate hydratase class I family protein